MPSPNSTLAIVLAGNDLLLIPPEGTTPEDLRAHLHTAGWRGRTVLDTKRKADALALRAEEYRFRLQKAMGESTALAWPDGRVAVTSKEQRRKGLDKKALEAERPDVAEVVRQYTRPGAPFRVFKVKEETQ